jgi:hypothetical protein
MVGRGLELLAGKLCPRTIQPGSKNRAGKTGKGNPYLKGMLGGAAAAKPPRSSANAR